MGQVHIEEARAAAGILIPPLDNVDSEVWKALNQEEMEEQSRQQGKEQTAKLRAALQSVRVPSQPLWSRLVLEATFVDVCARACAMRCGLGRCCSAALLCHPHTA